MMGLNEGCDENGIKPRISSVKKSEFSDNFLIL